MISPALPETLVSGTRAIASDSYQDILPSRASDSFSHSGEAFCIWEALASKFHLPWLIHAPLD
jgi:hypothetical protein